MTKDIAYWTYVAPVPDEQIIDELVQIDKDFAGDWGMNGNSTLWVTTPEIVLEHPKRKGKAVRLGKFRMKMSLSAYIRFKETDNGDYRRRIFKFDAITPVYPEDERTYVHPHLKYAESGVYDKNLNMCEGEAASALTRAAGEYRLADLFHILTSVISTYNPSSPFHHLENWASEKKCVDCAVMMEPRDAKECCYSAEVLCEDCATTCATEGCASVMAASSRRACAGCTSIFCNRCLSRACSHCKRLYCTSCNTTGICSECLGVQEDRLRQQADLEAERKAAAARRLEQLQAADPVDAAEPVAVGDDNVTVVYGAQTDLW